MTQRVPLPVAVAVLVGSLLIAGLYVGCGKTGENADYNIEHAQQVQQQQQAGGGHNQPSGAPAAKK